MIKAIYSKPRQLGATLIEIMIAMLIGLFLLGGVLQIFSSSKQTYRLQDNMSRTQENGRFAMDFITRDVRMADFWGCLKQGLNNVTNNLDPNGTGYDANVHDFTQGLAGTNGAAGANAALDAPDTISMRGVADGGLAVESPYGPLASANIKVEADNYLEQGDIVLVADCSQADIFQITNANPSTSGVTVHNTGNATEPGNCNYNATTCPKATDTACPGSNSHCLSKVYGPDAAIYKARTVTYSIQTGAGGRSALFRQIDSATALELVEGIENMQILYGVDTDTSSAASGFGTPNYYVEASSVPDMEQVVSVRINLLSVTPDDFLANDPVDYTYNGATTTPTDDRLRRVFSSTIAVRNRLN